MQGVAESLAVRIVVGRNRNCNSKDQSSLLSILPDAFGSLYRTGRSSSAQTDSDFLVGTPNFVESCTPR